ncbi:hypothetical protein, partial [Salmonella sp. SAL04284]|uniref:hypothetical protein n=1 Tax=Salmonella sp. SAL04284 TaxID=3159862 RepID=UPI00397DDCDC
VWIEAEETGNVLARDTRLYSTGVAAVKWHANYTGSVNIVVHFARVADRCAWSSKSGRLGPP